MATRVITTVFSLTPSEVQAELMRLLLVLSSEGVQEVPFTQALELLHREVGVPERVLASSQEVSVAALELNRKGLIRYEQGILRIRG